MATIFILSKKGVYDLKEQQAMIADICYPKKKGIVKFKYGVKYQNKIDFLKEYNANTDCICLVEPTSDEEVKFKLLFSESSARQRSSDYEKWAKFSRELYRYLLNDTSNNTAYALITEYLANSVTD